MCNWLRREFPDLIFVSDYAAGLNLTNTQRMKMATMRSHDGQPDISIDYAAHGYHGLRIELKAEGTVLYKRDGTLRKQPYKREYKRNGQLFIKRGDHLQEQADMLKRYMDAGYLGRFCVGETDFKRMVNWYMGRPEQTSLEIEF